MSLEPVTYDLANSMFPVSSIFHRYKPIKVKQDYKIKNWNIMFGFQRN